MPAMPADESRPSAEVVEQDKEAQGCRVYVGNLAWGVRTEELKEHMSQVGSVLRASVFEDYQGRSKGCGIVVYKDEDAAHRAIKELTDSQLQDRPIFVREDREESASKFSATRGGRGSGRGRGGGYSGGRGGGYAANNFNGGGGQQQSAGSGGRQIFVSNLPWKTSWQDLKDLFRECGEVVRSDVMGMPDGRSKGIGTVLFSTPEAAQRAVERFNNFQLEGRNISVRFDRKEF